MFIWWRMSNYGSLGWDKEAVRMSRVSKVEVWGRKTPALLGATRTTLSIPSLTVSSNGNRGNRIKNVIRALQHVMDRKLPVGAILPIVIVYELIREQQLLTSQGCPEELFWRWPTFDTSGLFLPGCIFFSIWDILHTDFSMRLYKHLIYALPFLIETCFGLQ